MLNPKEYSHILKCIEELYKIPAGSEKWWYRFRWLRERVCNSRKIGEITLDQFYDANAKLDVLEKSVKAGG